MKLMRGDMGMHPIALLADNGFDSYIVTGGAATVVSSALAVAQLKIP
jgi:hypothetical protein